MAWSEASGLLDYELQNSSKLLGSNVFGLHRSTVLDLLVRIKVLFEEFEGKYATRGYARSILKERGQKPGSTLELLLQYPSCIA